MIKRLIASLVCLTFSFSNLQYTYAQDFSINQLPVPGTMVGVSQPFAPLALKGLIVNPQKPLEFQFIVDTGSDVSLRGDLSPVSLRGARRATKQSQQEQLKQQANQLVKYFLAGLTIPEGDLWVNLSPYEKNRMVPEALGQTDLGRDLLAQDYILKQLTASLIYPEKDLGKEFWSRVYQKAQAQFGTTNVPVNTFNKVWILPDQAQVFENHNAAYVTKSTLKVMLDEDYLALQKHNVIRKNTVILSEAKDLNKINSLRDSSATPQNDMHILGSQIVREIVIPEITKEVNTGKNFAPLRQIYQALILAKWYKETIQNGLLDAVYTNKNKVAGVNVNDPAVKEQIYERYLKAYKKGAFNYIKEDPIDGVIARSPQGDEAISKRTTIPRKYFSGGLIWKMNLRRDGAMSAVKSDGAMLSLTVALSNSRMLEPPKQTPDAAMLERVQEYIDNIKTGAWDTKQSAMIKLFAINTGRDELVPVLKTMLGDKSWPVHLAAIKVLRSWGEKIDWNYNEKKQFYLDAWREAVKASIERKTVVYNIPLHHDLLERPEYIPIKIFVSDENIWNAILSDNIYDISFRHNWVNFGKEELWITVQRIRPQTPEILHKSDQNGKTITDFIVAERKSEFLGHVGYPVPTEHYYYYNSLNQLIAEDGGQDDIPGLYPRWSVGQNIKNSAMSHTQNQPPDAAMLNKNLEEITQRDLSEEKGRLVTPLLNSPEGIQAYPNTIKLIKKLKSEGIKTGVGTSSTSAPIVLKHLEIENDFDVIVDGNTAKQEGIASKPSPEFYLAVAKKLNIDPRKSVVVEDAVSGVEAAVNGGFGIVIGLARENDEEQLRKAGANIVLSDIGDLTAEQIDSHLKTVLNQNVNERILQGVIFDMDGVISNTTPAHFQAWKETFDNYLRLRERVLGEPFREFTNDDFSKYASGRTRPAAVKAFLESRGIDIPVDSAMQISKSNQLLDTAMNAGPTQRYTPLFAAMYFAQRRFNRILKEYNGDKLRQELRLFLDEVNNSRHRDRIFSRLLTELDENNKQKVIPLLVEELSAKYLYRSGDPYSIRKALDILITNSEEQYRVGVDVLNSIKNYYHSGLANNTIIWAIGMLGKSGKIDARGPVLEMFRNVDYTIRKPARNALEQLGMEPAELDAIEHQSRPHSSLPKSTRRSQAARTTREGIDFPPSFFGSYNGQVVGNYRWDAHATEHTFVDYQSEPIVSHGAWRRRDYAMFTSKANNGGIDLNQINVKRNGKIVNVQFDPAQLNALEQGGFEGFTPVIISIQHISSPFQLLGIGPAKEEETLAKV